MQLGVLWFNLLEQQRVVQLEWQLWLLSRLKSLTDRLFVKQLMRASNKYHPRTVLLIFCVGIYRWRFDSLKGPALWKALPCYDIITMHMEISQDCFMTCHAYDAYRNQICLYHGISNTRGQLSCYVSCIHFLGIIWDTNIARNVLRLNAVQYRVLLEICTRYTFDMCRDNCLM